MFSFFTTVSERDAKIMNPVTLAFVGDAVYSLYVRERLALSTDFSAGNCKSLPASMFQRTVRIFC